MKRFENTTKVFIAVTAIVTLVASILYPFALEWAKEYPYWTTFLTYLAPILIGNLLLGLILMWIETIFANRMKMVAETPQITLCLASRPYAIHESGRKMWRNADFVVSYNECLTVSYEQNKIIFNGYKLQFAVSRKPILVSFSYSQEQKNVTQSFKIFLNQQGKVKIKKCPSKISFN